MTESDTDKGDRRRRPYGRPSGRFARDADAPEQVDVLEQALASAGRCWAARSTRSKVTRVVTRTA